MNFIKRTLFGYNKIIWFFWVLFNGLGIYHFINNEPVIGWTLVGVINTIFIVFLLIEHRRWKKNQNN
jgi:hypothetical protein